MSKKLLIFMLKKIEKKFEKNIKNMPKKEGKKDFM